MVTDIAAAISSHHFDTLTRAQLRENFVSEPAPEVQVQATRDDEIDIIRISNKVAYQVGPPQMSYEELAEYEALTVVEKEKFHNERRAQLKRLAQALTSAKSPGHFIVSVKNKIIRNKVAQAGSEELSAYEKSAILNYYNSKQWKKARKLGKTFNLRGFSAVVGIKMILGFVIPEEFLNKYSDNSVAKILKFLQKYSRLGGGRFLAVDVAYNSESKTLILKIDRQKEKLDGGFAAEATLATKFFMYSAMSREPSHNTDAETDSPDRAQKRVEYGKSYYPPSIPIPFVAGGFGAETSEERVSAGLYLAFGPDAFPVGFSRGEYKKVTIFAMEVQRPLGFTKPLVDFANRLTRLFETDISYAQKWNKTTAAHQCRDFFY